MAEFLELLDALRATRDADSCLRGINLFRKGLRGEGGPSFLARFLLQSPDWQELQSVWDTQLTVQHYHVTVTLLLALADALRTATAAAANVALDSSLRAALGAGAASLAGSILHRRLKAVYFNLSSDVRGKSNAALALLSAVTDTLAVGAALSVRAPAAASGAGGGGASATGGASVRDLVRAFDWSLSALPGLARPPREKKGESSGDLRQRYWQQWELGDTLKRPTRALLSAWALALVRGAAGDALLTQQVLALRSLVGGLLHHVGADPPQQQLEVLRALQQRVLAPKAGVPAAVQADLFSDAVLQQLASIAAAATVEGEEEDEEGGAADASSAGQQQRQQRQAASAALAVLQALSTEPSHGLAATASSPGQQSFSLTEAGSHQLAPGQRRLLRMLLRLRPADSAAHLQLLLAAAEPDAPLAASLLLALPYSLEPAAAAGAAAAGTAAAGRWFAHAAVAARLLQLLPAAAPPGLVGLARGGGAAPAPGGRAAQALLRCCFPPCLQRAALNRGLQHSNALVRHGTLGLMVSAMSALEAVLQDCAAAADAAATWHRGQQQEQPAQQLAQGWLALRRWLQQAARQQLPDPTLLVALLSAAEKEGWEAANELQLTAVLRLLLLWQRLLPAALADANVDAERLMPQQPLALRPQHQLLLLELLHAAAETAAGDADSGAAGGDPVSGPAAGAGAALLPPLRLLAGSPAEGVRRAARAVLLQLLLATAVFAGNEEEAVLWIDLLPRGGEAVCSFFSEAMQLLLRRPHELFELQQQILEGVAAVGGAPSQQLQQHQFSLLAPCALRQLLRVLGSAKMPSTDKAAAAAYVASVLGKLAKLQISCSSGSAASGSRAFASLLLGVVRQEATRQQQQGPQQANGAAACKKGKKEKKRKAHAGEGGTDAAPAPLVLPVEGAPVLALLVLLEQQLAGQPAAGVDKLEEQPRKKSKKGRQSVGDGSNGVTTPCIAAVLASGGVPLPDEQAPAADACCSLISRIAAGGSGVEEPLAAVQQLLAAEARSGGSSSGGVGACSAAIRQCLHLLEQPHAAGAAPALLQVLYAALAAVSTCAAQQQRCWQLLAGSSLVATALAGGSACSPAPQALAATVAQLLAQTLSDGSCAASIIASCSLLLEQVSAAFLQSVAASAADDSSDALLSPAAPFLLLLPHMPGPAVEAASDALLARLAAGSADGGGMVHSSAAKQGKKKKSEQAGAVEAGAGAGPSWLAPAAAPVLQQLLCSGALHQRRLEQAGSVLPRLAAAGVPAAFSCLLRLLGGRQRAAALGALGHEGQAQLLRCCLAAGGAGAGDGGSLAARAQLAALLVERSTHCRALAAELLPSLLARAGGGDGGSSSGSSADLAVLLPAASALLSTQPLQGQDGGDPQGAGQRTQVAHAAGQALATHFSSVAARSAKEQNSAESQAGAPAEAQGLLAQHAVRCLRLALQAQPLPQQQRQQLLARLLPQSGWPAGAQLGAAGTAGTAQLAEAAVALVAVPSSGGGGSVAELAACVQCFAATLASLLKLPPGTAELEGGLLALLDGPLGDAVAALPSSQRATSAFAELAGGAAGTLGTAVLRHRLAPAQQAADGADATAGVVAMRVLRRFMAALLPDEAEDGGSNADGGSSESDSSGADEPMAERRQQLRSPTVATAALQLLQRLLGHSRFLPAMRATAASPPPLPPAAEALARPLASLLPLAAAADEATVGSVRPPGATSAATSAADMKKELCELIETLLDIHERFGGGAGDAGMQQQRQEQQQVAAAEAALLPLLMAGYGASCSPTDVAVWSLAAAINQRQWQRERAAGPAGAAAAELAGGGDRLALDALLQGPLSKSCFAWGATAAALQQLGPSPAGDEAQHQQRRQLLQQRLHLDPVRAGLTVCHWPEACVLAAPGSGSSQGSGSGDGGGQPPPLPGCAAAYDPGFLLPLACTCLRHQLMAPRAFAEAGLLSVCLRALASADSGCRAAGYQALALFEAQLGAAAAPGFKEKQQLSVLLGALRAAVTQPFQRLPAVHAVFLAEAALLALHPGAAMYPAANKHLASRAVLSTTDVPLLGRLLLSGGQQHGAERRWMMQLLVAGLRSAEDAALYRSKHAFEQAMALYDSCVADPGVASLALRLLCTATYVPRAARQLSHESGLIPWLAGTAQTAVETLAQQRQQQSRGGGGGAEAEQALHDVLGALRRLLQLRAVMRGASASEVALQMACAAEQLAATVRPTEARAGVGSTTAGSLTISAAPLHAAQQVLPFLQEVQLQLEGGASSSSKRAPGLAQALDRIRAAAEVLAAAGAS